MTGINQVILYGDRGYVEHALEYSDMAPGVTLKPRLKDKEDLSKSTMRDTGCSWQREQQAPRSGGRRERAVTEARVSVTHNRG